MALKNTEIVEVAGWHGNQHYARAAFN